MSQLSQCTAHPSLNCSGKLYGRRISDLAHTLRPGCGETPLAGQPPKACRDAVGEQRKSGSFL